MDGISSIYRRTIWHACVLCIVFGVNSANASTRKHVSMPTAQSVATSPSGPVTRTGGSLFVPGQPLEGEYIPGVNGKRIPVPGILPTIDFSIPRTITQGKNLLKGGAIGVGVSLGIDWLLGQVGAFIDENKVPVIQKSIPEPIRDLFWCNQFIAANCKSSTGTFNTKRYLNPAEAGPDIAQQRTFGYATWTYKGFTPVSDTAVKLNFDRFDAPSGNTYPEQMDLFRHGECIPPAVYSSELKTCATSQLVPMTDSDLDAAFSFANQQNAAWLSSLLKDVCANSPSPARCFEEMKQNSALSGPKIVPGETLTKTTNTTGSNGVVTQTVTNTKNTYNFTYGPTYYDYSKTTQITTTQDGVPVSDETITEPTDPEQEQEPDDKEDEEPVLCSGQGCDGPAYEDQYTPIDEKKEDYLDNYASRVSSIPIIQALNGLFDINVSGSCPVWTFDYEVPVIGASMPIHLVFDYLCLPWFTQYGPWIRAVIYLVAVYAAIRIALL